MDTPGKIAIIAALEREVHPLIATKGWRRSAAIRAAYGAFESGDRIVVCAGVGGRPARQAAEQVARMRPRVMISAGLAGSLVSEYKVGQVLLPTTVIDSATAVPLALSLPPELPGLALGGVLVSASGVAGPEGKRLLAAHYRAQAVDMEAASVAAVAAEHAIPFLAVKAISDEPDFPMPDMEMFITPAGRFLTGKFAVHVALRPRLWSVVSRLASNTNRATVELCRVLRVLLESDALRPMPQAVSGTTTSMELSQG